MADRVPARLSFTASEGRRFAFPVGLAFGALAGLLWWRSPGGMFGGPVALWMVFSGISAALLLAGLTIPASLGPVYRGWMAFAHALSKITTPIFMGIVYYVVMTPIGLVMRLFGRRAMVHQPENGGLWRRPPSGGRSNLDHQF